ncbi:MAG TPA: diacylglycerol kinase family protein [Thermoanaerobaculia bacterium]
MRQHRRRGVLFLNPRAGSIGTVEESALRTLAAENGLRTVDIQPGIDVRGIVRETLAAGLHDFIVAGGDGSVHHVAQALVGTEGILGVVPVGSVNHLARDLEIPLDWREAFEVALNGQVRQIDVGRVNGIYFLNSVMLGLYPTISVYREHFRSLHSKWRAYVKAGRLALRQFPHVTLVIEMDGRVQTLRTQMFVVAVNSYDLTATGLVAPKTSMTDGRLSIYSLSFMSRWQFIRAAAKYFRGRIHDVPGFRRVRTSQLRVDTGRGHLRVSVDGELLDMDAPLQIAAVPASLLVRA